MLREEDPLPGILLIATMPTTLKHHGDNKSVPNSLDSVIEEAKEISNKA